MRFIEAFDLLKSGAIELANSDEIRRLKEEGLKRAKVEYNKFTRIEAHSFDHLILQAHLRNVVELNATPVIAVSQRKGSPLKVLEHYTDYTAKTSRLNLHFREMYETIPYQTIDQIPDELRSDLYVRTTLTADTRLQEIRQRLPRVIARLTPEVLLSDARHQDLLDYAQRRNIVPFPVSGRK